MNINLITTLFVYAISLYRGLRSRGTLHIMSFGPKNGGHARPVSCSITSKHLQFSHPLLPCVLLATLFNFMMRLMFLRFFGKSYTVPLLKGGISPHG